MESHAPATTTSGIDPPANLTELLPILDAFSHRNKNQHHSSHWWSHFSLLRRNLRLLINQGYPLSRARWLRDRILPRSYIAFSQLAADNQHAPLGLLLLAVIARVHTILTKLLATKDSAPTCSVNRDSSKRVTNSETETDKGVTVSRSHTIPTPDLSSSILPSKSSTRPIEKDRPKPPKEGERKSKKSKKKKKGDELSSLFGSLT